MGSFKMTQNFKSAPKITYAFFKTLFCPIHPRSSSYPRKCHYFFLKIMLLPYHPHLHQIFTTLPLTSIPQPP